MKKKQVAIGIIGTGFGSMVHAPAFQRTENCTVAGIASRNPEHAQKAASAHGITHVFSDWKELIASPDIDAVSVAVPPVLHHEIITAAATAGKAILCEKPLCLTAKEASDCLHIASRMNIVHGMNFIFRELPVFAKLRDIMEEERQAGRKLRHVNVRWAVGSWADPNRPWAWQCDDAQGGGILGALVVHALDYMEWLFGAIHRLSSELDIAIRERPDDTGKMLPVTAPDHCHILATLADGTPLTCTVSNVAPRGTGHWIEVHGEEKTWIAGSGAVQDYGRGFIMWEGQTYDMALREIAPDNTEPPEGEDGRIGLMTSLARRFVGAVSGKDSFTPSFVQGARTRLLLDRIKEAADAGEWVDVAPPLG